MKRIILTAPNFSEGRDQEKIQKILRLLPQQRTCADSALAGRSGFITGLALM